MTRGTMPDSAPAIRGADPGRDFICPECGATSIAGRRRVSRAWPPDSRDPWSTVLHDVTCGGCGGIIPAHLGYRWGLTREAAQHEWVERYRGTGP